MDVMNVQTLWQIMEALRDANQLEDALGNSLDIFCGATKSDKGSIWMLDDASKRTVAVMAQERVQP